MQPYPGFIISDVTLSPALKCCSLEQSTKHLVSASRGEDCCGCMVARPRRRIVFRVWARNGSKPVAPQELIAKRGALVTRARGDDRLSVNNKGGSFRSADKAMQKKSPDEKKNRKQKASDIGRALRTIYDDTLRETVPDDFSDLLGKLS